MADKLILKGNILDHQVNHTANAELTATIELREILAFGKPAENGLFELLEKGRPVCIEGRLRTREGIVAVNITLL